MSALPRPGQEAREVVLGLFKIGLDCKAEAVVALKRRLLQEPPVELEGDLLEVDLLHVEVYEGPYASGLLSDGYKPGEDSLHRGLQGRRIQVGGKARGLDGDV